MRGCFIVFEGIDGAGKTVQFYELAKNLQNNNYKVVLTREPTTNRPIGKLIRKILYNDEKVSDEALALLFAADRADHTKGKILPALKEGSVVLSDRYIYSSFAYQGRGMKTELNLKWLRTINRYAVPPDIVIFLDIPPDIGLNRLQQGQKRIQDDSYFEDLIKQEKIRSIYYKVLNLERNVLDLWEFEGTKKINKNNKMELIRINGTQVLRIDGTQSIDEIQKNIFKYVTNFLEKKHVSKIVRNKLTTKELFHFANDQKIESSNKKID